jgi:uncharacterized protein
MSKRVIIAGVTTRALATSAARSGWQVTALDGFGDQDLRALAVDVVVVRTGAQGYTPELLKTMRSEYAAYTSNLENYPESVALLESGRKLLGNPPEVLRQARDPMGLMRMFRRQGFITPLTRAATAPKGNQADGWLLKPRRSGGGHGTRLWRRRKPVSRSHYLQQRIEGIPGSVLFVADGSRALVLGLSRQLVGERGLGARGFRYCGSLFSTGPAYPLFPWHPRVEETAGALADAATAELKLVGLNGIDFIARLGVPYPIELNPRYSASMELVERAHGVKLFELHASACEAKLPGRVARASSAAGVVGKAVVFARRSVTIGDTQAWLLGGSIADVPHAGEHIRRGHPICTVFAEGSSVAACRRTLLRRAESVYRSVAQRARGAA